MLGALPSLKSNCAHRRLSFTALLGFKSLGLLVKQAYLCIRDVPLKDQRKQQGQAIQKCHAKLEAGGPARPGGR